MKIGVDIRGTVNEKAGKGYYAFHLVKALLSLNNGNKYILYSNKSIDSYDNFKNATVKIIDKKGLFWHKKVLSDAYKENLEIFIAPTSYIIPALHNPNKIKVLMAVHDLIAFLYPENHNKKAVLIEKLTLGQALKKIKKVLSVSENTKKDLINRFGVKESLIEIIHNAASDSFGIIEKEECEILRKHKKLPKEFIFSVGTLEPRKNYETLIEAYSKIRAYHPQVKLVIAGKNGWKSENIFKKVKELKLENDVIFLGYVTENELAKLYNLATIFAYPSLYEGFGIPPLEAMKCGCPAITSNTSSLPEVVGDAAILVNPNSTEELKNTLHKLLSTPSLRENLKNKGLEQYKKFSWKTSARKLLAIINKV
ncbi:glycosyltransferase family 4 protein [bacterium]|nr:glycosyltransferase family 4 protein [bacterium]